MKIRKLSGILLAGVVSAGTIFSGGLASAYAEEETTETVVEETETTEGEVTEDVTSGNVDETTDVQADENPSADDNNDEQTGENNTNELEEKTADTNDSVSYGGGSEDYVEKVLSSTVQSEDVSSYPPPAESGVTRYTVLVIDDSGSMRGEAGEKTIAAAKRFCDQYFMADGTNYVAIVAFGDGSTIKQTFTNSKDEAYTAIDSFTFYDGTNTNSGLTEAYSLSKNIPASDKIIKNIVILSDGLPEVGDWDDSGEFTEEDNDWSYGYANVAVKTAKTMFNDYNIYSLGFFHSLDDEYLDYARRVMKALQNDGYYEVTNVNDLEFTFGEVAEEITKEEEYPVIVIPGIMGSQLYNSKGEKVWLDVTNLNLSTLKDMPINNTLHVRNRTLNNSILDNDNAVVDYLYGNKEYGTIYPEDINLKEKDLGDNIVDLMNSKGSYKKMIDYLSARFKHVYFFSYDWRKSNADSGEELREEIEQIKEITGSDKVNIVAHSMGGLVTSYYVKKYGTDNINRIVTCATPYEGSPMLLNTTLTPKAVIPGQGVEETKDVPHVIDNYTTFRYVPDGVGRRSSIISLITQLLKVDVKERKKFPSLAELVPTKEYYKTKNGGWNWINSTTTEDIRELKGRELNFFEKTFIYNVTGKVNVYETQAISYNAFSDICSSIFGNLYNDAVDFHNYIKTPSGSNILADLDNAYFVIGRNERTIVSGSFVGVNNIKDLYYMNDGDGTVPIDSATMCGTLDKMNEIDDDRVLYVKDDHGLYDNEKTLEYITKVFSGYNNINVEDDVRTNKKIVQVSIRCPVDIRVERNGEELSSEQYILRSSYGRLDFTGEDGDIKSLCLDDDGFDYDVKLNGTDTGTMDLLLRWYDEDSNVVTEKTFYEIPVTEKTLMNFSLQEDGTSELYVDNDGDGIIDDTWYSAVGDVGYRIVEEGGESENSNNEESKEENKETENKEENKETKNETQAPVTERKESGSTAQPVNVVKKAASTATATKATTTGDSNYTALWISLSAEAAAAAITAGVVYTRKRKSN